MEEFSENTEPIPETPITEKFSDIQEKKKRGRPPKRPGIRDYWRIDEVTGHPRSTRQLNNQVYYSNMIDILARTNEFAYLFDNQKQIIRRKTIITMLGRLREKYPEEDVMELMRIICKGEYTTADATELIRRYRIDRGEEFAQNKAERAFRKIRSVIFDYHLTQEETEELYEMLTEIWRF
jgi:hypothetical protein